MLRKLKGKLWIAFSAAALTLAVGLGTISAQEDGRVTKRELQSIIYAIEQRVDAVEDGLSEVRRLRQQVSALEEANTELAEGVESLEERLSAIEESSLPFQFTTEAESFTFRAPFSFERDNTANGNRYLGVTSGTPTDRPRIEASYNFEVPRDGTYYLWARLYGPNQDSDAMYIGIDGSWTRAYPATTGQYVWTRIAVNRNNLDKFNFELSSGVHQVHLGHAEVGARIDTIVVTDDPGFRP